MITRRPFPGPRKRRDIYGDLIIDGYTYMGHGQIPRLPQRIAMADRVTGQMKVLGQDGVSILLQDIQPYWSDVTKFGPLEGPYTNEYRLYLSNGVLSAEYAPGYSSQRIFTRDNNNTSVLEITVNPNNGAIVLTPTEL